MNDESPQSVLRRLIRDAESAGAKAVTPTRLLRLAMARAAEKSIGLQLTVLGVQEDFLHADDLPGRLSLDNMIVALLRRDKVVGIAMVDSELRCAAVEVQTVGDVQDRAAEERPVTAGDIALCEPLVATFLADLDRLSTDSSLEDWVSDVEFGTRLTDRRSLELALPEARMRLVELSVDLGAGERQGTLTVIIREKPEVERPAAVPKPAFSEALRNAVFDANARLRAEMPPLHLPIRRAELLQEGDVLPLTGITVDSVRLVGDDNRLMARGRLGQINGLRAIRIESFDVLGGAHLGQLRDGLGDAVGHAMDQSDVGSIPALPGGDDDDAPGLPDLPDLPDLPIPDAEAEAADFPQIDIDAAPLAIETPPWEAEDEPTG